MTSSELPRLKQSKAIPPVSLKKAGRVAYKPAAAPVSPEEESRRHKSLAAEGALLSLLTVLNEAAMTDTELQTTLQAVKAALFARDYTLAFSRPVSRVLSTRGLRRTRQLISGYDRTTSAHTALAGSPDALSPGGTSYSTATHSSLRVRRKLYRRRKSRTAPCASGEEQEARC